MTKKLKKKLRQIAYATIGMFFVVFSLLVAGNVVLASSHSEVEKELIRSAALCVVNHPDSESCTLLLKYLIQANANEANVQDLGLLLQPQNRSITETTCHKDSDSLICRVVGWEEMDLPAASVNTTTVAELNRLSSPYWVDYMMVEMEGTVSGSNQGITVSVGTSTNGFGPIFNASTTDGAYPQGLIARSHFATSSQAVQFANGYNYINYRVASSTLAAGNALGNVNPLWRIPTTTYITAFVQVGGNTSTAGFCDPGVVGISCEQVTSSNRGWTGRVIWRYHYRLVL